MPAPSFVASDSSTPSNTSPISHTVPSGWSVGDLVLAVVLTSGRTVTAAPSGWTLVASRTGTIASNTYVYRRELGAGDPGTSYSWTLSANPYAGRIVYLRITGHNSASPIDTSATGLDASSTTNHVTPILTTTQVDCLLVRTMTTPDGGQATTASSGNTGTKQYEVTADQPLSVWSYAWSGSGAESAAATYTTSASRQYGYVSVAVAPTAGGSVYIPGPFPGLPGAILAM
jgi:hypothetical protein